MSICKIVPNLLCLLYIVINVYSFIVAFIYIFFNSKNRYKIYISNAIDLFFLHYINMYSVLCVYFLRTIIIVYLQPILTAYSITIWYTKYI